MSEALPTVEAEATRLVDKSIIAAAGEAKKAARQRLLDAEEKRKAARIDVSLAKVEMDKALNGQGGDVVALHKKLEDAERAARLADLVHEAASRADDKAEQDRQREIGRAHQPLFAEGIRRRLEAAKKHDAARALMIAAQKEFDLATHMLNHATANGTFELIQNFGQLVVPYDEEVRRWTGESSIRVNWWDGWKALVGEEAAA